MWPGFIRACRQSGKFGNFRGAKMREISVVHDGAGNPIEFKECNAKFSLWRPGGKGFKEWWWYNGAATAAYEVEIGGKMREIMQAN